MSDDIRLSVSFFSHHKTVKLERRLGLPGVKALISLWMWTAQNRPTGILVGMSEEDIEIASGWDGETDFVATLVELNWIDSQGEWFSVHGWAENQPWIIGADARKEKARKANAKRWADKDEMPQASSEDTPRNPPLPSLPIPSSPKKKEILFVGDSEPLRLAEFFYSLILANNPKFTRPNMQAWARHVDLLMRKDGRTSEEISAVMEWVQSDTEPRNGFCWARVVLSTEKLRKQFSQLEMNMPGGRAVKVRDWI